MEMRWTSGPQTTWFEKVVLVHEERERVFDVLAALGHVPAAWRRKPFELAGYEPPRRLTLAGVIGPFEVVLDHDLGQTALGTVVTVHVELQPAGRLPDDAVWVGVVSQIQAEVAASLERLKRLPEGSAD
jgi:hypothetical protein